MKNYKRVALFFLIEIISLGLLSTVSAKSYNFIINEGSGQYVHFTKYHCNDYTHSTLNASKISTNKISITTTIHQGESVNSKAISSHNHVYSSNSMTDEWNWGKTSTKIITIKSVNSTKNSSLTGRLYINNGKIG